ncbi:MAG: hypothetical protein K8H87_09830 [Pseudorhodoplanes sp.]|nr:hypothetical protein [Pseudorhodoplanes sp.]
MNYAGGVYSEHGFNLVEVCFGIVIFGLLAAGAMNAYDVYKAHQKILVTDHRLTVVEDALNNHVAANIRYPCVAPLTAQRDTPEYGQEVSCVSAAAPGTFSAIGRAGINVRIGAVPVRNLGLPDEYAQDAWGRNFLYAVTGTLAIDETTYIEGDGAVLVRDSQDNSLLTPPGTAAYVLLSHGADAAGAYYPDAGVLATSCDPAALDGENCNDDATFRDTLLWSGAPGGGHFDDIVLYRPKRIISIPTLARYLIQVMPCNPDPTLPASWANPLGNGPCASAGFGGNDIFINPAAGEQPDNGVQVDLNPDPLTKSITVIASADGTVLVRSMIPSRYINGYNGSFVTEPWEEDLMVALYINGTLITTGSLIDPASNANWSDGAASFVVASEEITEGLPYTIDMFVFTLGNENSRNAGGANAGWAGSMQMHDHDVQGVVEIMELTIES